MPRRRRAAILLGPGSMARAVATTDPQRPATTRRLIGILRRSLRDPDAVVELELPRELAGIDLAKAGHRGIRTFDFSTGIIGRIVQPPDDVRNEARSLDMLAGTGIAPPLSQVSSDGRWMTEVGVHGHDLRFGSSVDVPRHLVDSLARQLLLPLWNASPITTIARENHVLGLHQALLARIPVEAGPEVVDRTRRALDQLVLVAREADPDIPLVWSHGDLFSKNVLRTSTGLCAIDWEYSKHRSPALDTFGFAFERVQRTGSTVDAGRLIKQIATTVRRELSNATTPALEQISAFFEPARAAFAIGCLELIERGAGVMAASSSNRRTGFAENLAALAIEPAGGRT